ncbi:FxLYD domain-containing protein [Aeoliella mucimassa]|uniref:FxLYD domain-containing protein n=1 Tax=Aeoliella mucimassa TaxID=2527972 RepID=UPI0011A62534|nr:FxLYD domain-containing protein [Aeoliella mucimassa]
MLSAVALSIACCLATSAEAREIKSVKFEVLDSSSVGLPFTPRKVEWVLGKVRVEGTVRNTSPDDYEWIEVVYTALDRNGNVLGSDVWHVTPLQLASGEIGEVDGDLINTKGRIPSVIQVEIVGETP